MNNEKQNIVPVLRFPEFLKNWEMKNLGDCIEIKGRIGYRGYTVNDIVKKGEGAIAMSPSNIDVSGILSFKKTTFISWFKYEESPEIMLRDGYTVLVKTGSSFGKAAYIKDLPEKSTINPQLVVLKPISINDVYLFYLVSHSNIQNQISNTIVGGAIPTLSQTSLSKFRISIPEAKEQQKIANCLSSLDNLISAETDKLEHLKDHKKGLLQQLFPANGETKPQFRFPEFENDGDWEDKMISELANRFDNLRKPITASDRIEGTTPYYGANGIQSYIEGYTHNGEFILVAEDGANDLKNYPVQYATGKIWVNNHAHVLQAKIDICNNLFLMYAIQNANIEPYLVGGGRAKLNANIMMKINLLAPELLEQQKIADCLSSADDLIASQTTKIRNFKKHKKGLMQQLFPNTNNVK